ncbi:uncharacterized protein LOC118439489 [Folsomia candida]|uniref:uncharacterized protein LOC118439489 n=1 Tax=Folsomia candida TaxID=158441 RepID=UPI0016053CC5|nr:uncharacterized protein LOC118439489 [Folsomia candida]
MIQYQLKSVAITITKIYSCATSLMSFTNQTRMDHAGMFTAFDVYARQMQHFTEPPIQWCTSKKKFNFATGQFKNYLWYFNTFAGFGLCTVGGLVVILLSQLFKFYKDLHAAYVFMFVVQLSTSAAGFAVNVEMILYGEDCVKGWNALLGMDKILQSRARHHSLRKSRVWQILTIFSWAFSTYPIVFTLAGIYFQFDPYYHILSMLNVTHPAPHIFRFYLIFTAPAELCRFISFMVLFSISTLHMLRDALFTEQNRSPFRISGTLAEWQYRQVQILVVNLETYIGNICLVAQGLGLANGVLCNFCARYFAKSVANFVPVYYMSVEAGEEEVEQGGQVVEKCYHFANVGRVQVFRV